MIFMKGRHMKTFIKTAVAMFIGATAFNASALIFEFDPEQDGTFIDVAVLTTNMFPNDPIVVQQFFGGDRRLNSGDTFAEAFTYNNTTSTGIPNVQYPSPDLTFSLTLTGSINNVVYGAVYPIWQILMLVILLSLVMICLRHHFLRHLTHRQVILRLV